MHFETLFTTHKLDYVTELMNWDLRTLIKSDFVIADVYAQYLLYQLLRGIKFIHSADVLHRDLKPSNILIDSEYNVKICDFGLARGIDVDNPEMSTQYVATRWYRAPELLLMWDRCSKEQDLWAIGCIFYELIAKPRRPLFPGKDYLSQLNITLDFCGTPAREDFHGSKDALKYLEAQKIRTKVDIFSHPPLKDASQTAVDLLDKLLEFDPTKRYTIDQALHHPYLQELQDDEDEPNAQKFIFRYEDLFANKNTNVDIKKLLYQEIMEYRDEIYHDRGDFDVTDGVIDCN
jgi:serine/threonine protein kinase